MRSRKRSARDLGLERLEDRVVPASFYVDVNGNDSNSGTSESPWLTLQHAANQARAGDTVIVRPGNYAGFDLRTDGTAAERIVFAGQAGATITTRNARTDDGINLEGADYITIEGFNVVGIGRAGIRSVTNTGVVIRNNNCDQNGRWGIFTGFSENILIENNVTTRSGAEHGIYFSNSADNPVIRGNTSWGNNGCGIHMNGDVSMGGDGIISNALVESNVIFNNGLGGGSAINCDGVRNSVIRNNLIYDAHASGISLYRIDGGGSSTGNRIVNNTVLVASNGRWAINLANGATGTVLRNNVLYSDHSFRGAITASADSLTNLVSNFNIVEGTFSVDGGNSAISLNQWRALTGLDASSLNTDNPGTLFVSAASGDYHIASGSMAIDVGTSNGAPGTDFEGTARPSGTGYDIGHDEFGGTSPPPPPPPPDAEPFAAGTSAGEPTSVTMHNADGTIRFAVQPFGPSYTRGARVAVGDVTGDGVPDIVAGTNGGIAAQARIIDGSTGAVLSSPLFAASAYRGPVSVAVGDVTGDGIGDVVLGTNSGGPHVRVFRGGDLAAVTSFHAGGAQSFRGQTQVALAEMTGDNRADLVVTGLYTGGTRVIGYRGDSLDAGVLPAKTFRSFTLGGAFVNGLFLAVGDVNDDGVGDLVLGSRGTATANVKVFSGDELVSNNSRMRIAKFSPASDGSPSVRVAIRDVDGDGSTDIIASAGGVVSAYEGGAGLPAVGLPPLLISFDPDPLSRRPVWIG